MLERQRDVTVTQAVVVALVRRQRRVLLHSTAKQGNKRVLILIYNRPRAEMQLLLYSTEDQQYKQKQ